MEPTKKRAGGLFFPPGKSPTDRRTWNEDGATAIDREGGNPIDMRGVREWKSVLSADVSEYSWGQLIVAGEARTPQPIPPTDTLFPENWPWIEVRIEININGQVVTILEAAVGSHSERAVIGDSSKSCGPILLSFAPGEVPDRIEVYARARRGGREMRNVLDGEKLELTASTRFHV
ncbi:MAG TPA: hypothetical protein VNH17_07730 [Streptosporangiaceae bacterium]|nr:hypothetical protein [Streptosporangiaceae bacterium]